eukprot:scaffold334_cov241-Pinguiococcus_pyrenoidosus.AAC.54
MSIMTHFRKPRAQSQRVFGIDTAWAFLVESKVSESERKSRKGWYRVHGTGYCSPTPLSVVLSFRALFVDAARLAADPPKTSLSSALKLTLPAMDFSNFFARMRKDPTAGAAEEEAQRPPFSGVHLNTGAEDIIAAPLEQSASLPQPATNPVTIYKVRRQARTGKKQRGADPPARSFQSLRSLRTSQTALA